MLRANAESTATKLGEHTKAAEKAMETLASGVKSSMDSMGSRIGSVEHDVNALRLEIEGICVRRQAARARGPHVEAHGRP